MREGREGEARWKAPTEDENATGAIAGALLHEVLHTQRTHMHATGDRLQGRAENASWRRDEERRRASRWPFR